jgi:hypothetical protein
MYFLLSVATRHGLICPTPCNMYVHEELHQQSIYISPRGVGTFSVWTVISLYSTSASLNG